MSNENLRLIEERGKLKRQTERLEDTIQSIIRAIAQEVPVEEGLSKKLINSPREDSEALIKDMQEVLVLFQDGWQSICRSKYYSHVHTQKRAGQSQF